MTTPILAITEIAGSQLNQYITANEMIRALESAANDFLSVSLSAGNVTLTDEQFFASFCFVSTGNTVARVLTVPQKKRYFVVKNGGSFDLTVTRGTSTVVVAPNDAAAFYTDATANGLTRIGGAGGGGAITGFTTGKNTAAPNATVPVCFIAADDTAANVDFSVAPKGTGALIMGPVPDSTTTGGNKRGAGAIDLQSGRSGAGQVASGPGAIAIGQNNTSSGSQLSIAIGYSCVSSAAYSVSVGSNNTVSGNYSAGIGYFQSAAGNNAVAVGAFNSANTESSMALGRFASAGAILGNHAFSNDRFSTTGDSQKTQLMLRRQSSDATPAAITSNQSAGGATNQKTLVDNSVVAFDGFVTARQGTTGDCAAWKFSGVIKRGSGAASTAIVGSVTLTAMGADAGAAAWAVSIVANATYGCLSVETTGETSKTIRWMCVLDCVELTY